jgi:hypothetical protein
MPNVRATEPGQLDPVHPGEVLLEDFLTPMKLSQLRLATETGLPVSRINAIVRGDRAITAVSGGLNPRHFDVLFGHSGPQRCRVAHRR